VKLCYLVRSSISSSVFETAQYCSELSQRRFAEPAPEISQSRSRSTYRSFTDMDIDLSSNKRSEEAQPKIIYSRGVTMSAFDSAFYELYPHNHDRNETRGIRQLFRTATHPIGSSLTFRGVCFALPISRVKL
jgi:hypothetical protein